MLLLYCSGHGVTDPTAAPSLQFAVGTNDTRNEQDATGIGFSWLLPKLQALKMSVVCFIDCCHSGKALAALSPGDGKHNLALFASSASDQKSYATIDQKYSRFTEFLARSLTGRIPDDAIESREVTTHTFAKSIRAHEWHEDQQPKCYEGRKAIGLARPNVPVAVPFRMPQEHCRSIFRRYIEGHLSELQDEVEVTSNEYFTVARCQRYLLKGLPYGRQKDVPTEGVLTDRLQAWAETEQPLLLVLGDTGLGKTTNLQRFWYDQGRAWI